MSGLIREGGREGERERGREREGGRGRDVYKKLADMWCPGQEMIVGI